MQQRTMESNQLILVRTDSVVRCFYFYIKFYKGFIFTVVTLSFILILLKAVDFSTVNML